jgi:hypothetical protein
MRLAYAIELTALFAVGFALARWHVQDPRHANLHTDMWLQEAGDAFFAGAAVIGSLGLFAEVASRRPSRPWGPGRWAWSVVGLFVISRYALLLVYRAIRYHRHRESLGNFFGGIPEDFRNQFSYGLLNVAPFILIALGVTRLTAGRKPVPADAREWAGRMFAALIVISGITANISDAAWH